jgi:hypothetical protein
MQNDTTAGLLHTRKVLGSNTVPIRDVILSKLPTVSSVDPHLHTNDTYQLDIYVGVSYE